MSNNTARKEVSFSSVISAYADSVDSLLITLPSVMGIMDRELKGLGKQFNEYLEKHGEKLKEENGVSTFSVKGKAASKAAKYRRLLDNGKRAYALVHRGFLISLISQYDAYLGRLIRLHLYIHPERLDASEKQFAFKDLVSLGSIEEARESLIEREVDAVIRKSHDEQLEWVGREFKLKIIDFVSEGPAFVEIAQRRHLFVHCDGVVSAQYITKCRMAQSTLQHDIAVGTQLEVSQEYLQKAFETLYGVGIKLGIMIWLHSEKDKAEAADDLINTLALNLISEDRHALAIDILRFSLDYRTDHPSDRVHRYQILNLAQAFKWSGQTEKCESVLARFDWSACGDAIQLGLCCLRNDFESAAHFSRKLFHDPGFKEHYYREWPIFKEYRQSLQFQSVYRELHGVNFEESQEKEEQTSSQKP